MRSGDPNLAGVIGHILKIVVHGDANRTVLVIGPGRRLAALKKVEADVEYSKGQLVVIQMFHQLT